MSEVCVRFINQLKGDMILYETKHATWRARLDEIIKQKDSAWTEYDNADNNITSLAPNATLVTHASRRAGGIGRWESVRCADWGDGECNNRCSGTGNTYKTPQGRPTRWGYYRTSHANSDCSWVWQHHCVCQYHSIDHSLLNTLKAKYDDLVKQEATHRTTEPAAPIIDVSCCQNDISCTGGKCYGNIQICQTFINSKVSKEDEQKILEQIKMTNNLFNQLLVNYNKNIKKLETYYINFQNLESRIKNEKNLNINAIFLEIKNLFEYVQTSFNIIFSNLESIYNYYLSIIESNGRITTTSFKSETNTIINNVRTLVNKSTIDYKAIIIKYDEIKTFWEKMELHKNNLDTMIFKKKLIDDNLKNFNIGIENVNNNNIEINSLVVNDNISLENLLKLVDNTNNIFKNQIINTKQAINNLFAEIKILVNTIPPQSIFYNIANDIFVASENTNILVNTKFAEIEEIINKNNIIGTTKKKNYETQKQINEDNKILYALEEQENNKKSDLLLLQLIEDEEKNKLLNSINQNIPINSVNQTTPINNVNQTTPIDITQMPIFTPMSLSKLEESQKMDYTVYIIIGVVVVVIIIIFLFMNK
jgi:hypothetical protein